MDSSAVATPADSADRLRVRLDFAYDGTDFSGWAAQPGRRTVEAELSAALTTVLRSAEPVRLTAPGRTPTARWRMPTSSPAPGPGCLAGPTGRPRRQRSPG